MKSWLCNGYCNLFVNFFIVDDNLCSNGRLNINLFLGNKVCLNLNNNINFDNFWYIENMWNNKYCILVR